MTTSIRNDFVIDIDSGRVRRKVTTAPIDCVLDLNGFGDVVGIEILNLAHSTRFRIDQPEGKAFLGSREVAWSYDKKVDAFYILLENDRSLDQLNTECTIEGDDKGNIVRIIVVATVCAS